jgi:hypothetical protein
VRGLLISGIEPSPPLCLFNGDERRGIEAPAAGIGILAVSIDEGLLFRRPLSVLLRCKPGLVFSTEPDEEFVLLREC